jgi:hypothetical protein
MINVISIEICRIVYIQFIRNLLCRSEGLQTKATFTPPPNIRLARENNLLFSQKQAKICFGNQNAVSVRSTSTVPDHIDLDINVRLGKRNGTDLKNFGKFNLGEVDLKTILLNDHLPLGNIIGAILWPDVNFTPC